MRPPELYARTYPDVFNLAGVDQATNLSLFHTHALGELPLASPVVFVQAVIFSPPVRRKLSESQGLRLF